jgi:hypothetical protein
MSRDAKGNAWSLILATAYVVVGVVLWVVAYQLDQDRSRAALIGAAGAFSVGGAAVLGAWFNGWREGRLRQAQQDRQDRKEAYVRLLGSLADYGDACKSVLGYKQIAETPAPKGREGAVEKAKGELLLAYERARAVRGVLLQNFAAVELIPSAPVAQAVTDLRAAIDRAPEGEVVVDASMSTEFLTQTRRELGYGS